MNAMGLEVLKKFVLAFSSQNRMWDGIEGSEDDDPEPWRGFRDGVDMHYLGAMMQSIHVRAHTREREREQNLNACSKKKKYA